MTDAHTIAADASWLPHRIDVETRQVEFLRIPRETLANTGFLSDRDPPADQRAMVAWDEVLAMKPEPGQLHFIFHTAFCRSTLLVRAMNLEGTSVGLAEPGILAQLAGAGEAASDLVKPVCDLLARPWGEGEAVFVKPTNHANMLIPALLAARPDATAVLMTNPLASFLRSVDKRALMGRRWGRQLYLEVMSYAGMDLGMDGREQFSMTDLQASALAWFLSQRLFSMLQAGPEGARLRVLDGDRFDLDRADTVEAVLALAGLPIDPQAVERVVDGPLFRSHAKMGGEFAEEGAAAPAFTQECDQVAQWIGMIAEQAGLAVPVKQTLF